MAADLGKKLLAEVEEEGLDQILTQLRCQQDFRPSYLSFEPIDTLIRQAFDIRAVLPSSAPFIELSSISPGQGKTHLLYHLISLAILPTYLGGNQSTVIYFDTGNTVSVPRLATQIRLVIKANSRNTFHSSDLEAIVTTSLQHIHIFRPQTLASLIATIETLPTYLFDPKAHHSIDRKPAFVALDSLTTFYWTARANTDSNQTSLDEVLTEQDAVPKPPSTSSNPASKPPSPATSLYNALATSLQSASRSLGNCPIIYTAHSLSLLPITTSNAPNTYAFSSNPRSLRVGIPGVLGEIYSPAIDTHTPTSSPTLNCVERGRVPQPPILRLILHRTPVRPFPVRFSVEEALREKKDRQKAVEEGRFEVVVNEWGLSEGEERRRIREGEMSGFGFRISKEGVMFDAKEEADETNNS